MPSLNNAIIETKPHTNIYTYVIYYNNNIYLMIYTYYVISYIRTYIHKRRCQFYIIKRRRRTCEYRSNSIYNTCLGIYIIYKHTCVQTRVCGSRGSVIFFSKRYRIIKMYSYNNIYYIKIADRFGCSSRIYHAYVLYRSQIDLDGPSLPAGRHCVLDMLCLRQYT